MHLDPAIRLRTHDRDYRGLPFYTFFKVQDADRVTEIELDQRPYAGRHRMHNHRGPDLSLALYVKSNELFKAPGGPRELTAMHGEFALSSASPGQQGTHTVCHFVTLSTMVAGRKTASWLNGL